MDTQIQCKDGAQDDGAVCSMKCSATVESANEWAQVGRDCLKKAMEAIAESHFGTADQYRKAADEAFAKELRLRESPNSKLSDGGGL